MRYQARRKATTAERAFLRTLGSGCHLAAGAFGRFAADGRTLALDALGDKPSDVDFPFLMNLLMHQRAALRVSQTAKEWMERVFAK